MTEEQLKELLLSKKDEVKRSLKEMVVYENWDRKSPVFVYDMLTGNIEKIEVPNSIEWILFKYLFKYCIAFTNKEAAEIYKWLYDTIAHEIDNKICEGFTDNINKFVEHRELHVADASVFSVTEV